MNIELSRIRESSSRTASSEIPSSSLVGLLISKLSPITTPFIEIENVYSIGELSHFCRQFPTSAEIRSFSLRSPPSGTTYCLVDPLSDIGRTIFELDAICLATAEKFDRILVDECHVPQIQN